ncbi:MAG: M23 family metallopeptidase [Clostridia bacterium]|nr:M23 family metallopeptidase [Clostridia bacterium]
MKMKYNIPKIKDIMNKVNIVKGKIKRKKENNIKIQPRYYGLLFLMILLGVVTVATNIKTYNDITAERYIKYELPKDIQTDANDVDIIKYETAISSISTNVSNITEEKNTNKLNSKEKTKDKYIWPVEGDVITEYAKDTLVYSKTLDMWLIHTGIDIQSELGTNVLAIANGKVISVENNTFYGNVVKIEHDEGYISVYANLAEEKLPKLNQKIKQGDIIGAVGDTAYGESEEEIHLHFEITKNNTNINPEEFLEIKE